MSAKNPSRDQLDDLIACARHMRSHPTHAEATLWEKLRAKRLNGYKFRRQHIIPPFIVDFYCAELGLIIEIDGPIHQAQNEYDQQRTKFLESFGKHVIRFTNQRILEEIDEVLCEIYTHIKNIKE